jgi:hypothetical protein
LHIAGTNTLEEIDRRVGCGSVMWLARGCAHKLNFRRGRIDYSLDGHLLKPVLAQSSPTV